MGRRRGTKWARDAEPWTADDVVLWRVKHKDGEVWCAECGVVIELYDVYEESDGGRRCRDCLGMSSFRFVPAGDGGLTRAVSAHAEARAVVVRRYGRDVFRDGILVSDAAVKCAADRKGLEPDQLTGELLVSRDAMHRQREEQRSLRRDDNPSTKRRKRRRNRKPKRPGRSASGGRSGRGGAKSSRYWPDGGKKRRQRGRRATAKEKALAKRIGKEMPESRQHRRLEVARWAVETLGAQTEHLSAKTIVLRWIRR